MFVQPATVPDPGVSASSSSLLGHWPARASAALQRSAVGLLVVMLSGQFVFAAYVTIFYGGAALAGEYERWSNVLPRGYVEGDVLGNAMLGLHLLLRSGVAALLGTVTIVIAGGALVATMGLWLPRIQ